MFKGRLLSLLMVALLAMGVVGCSIFGSDDDDTPTTSTTEYFTFSSSSNKVSFPTDASEATASIKAGINFANYKVYINDTEVTFDTTTGAFSGKVVKATDGEYKIEVKFGGSSKAVLKAIATADGLEVNSTTTAIALAYAAYKAQSSTTGYTSFYSLLNQASTAFTALKTKIETALKSISTSTDLETAAATEITAVKDEVVVAASTTTTSTTTTTSSTTTTTSTSTDKTAPTISSPSVTSKTTSGGTFSWTTSETVSTNNLYILRSTNSVIKGLTASTTWDGKDLTKSGSDYTKTGGTTLTYSEVVNNANYHFSGTGGTSTAQSLAVTGLPKYAATTEAVMWYVPASTDAAGNTGYYTLPATFTISTDSTSRPSITIDTATTLAASTSGADYAGYVTGLGFYSNINLGGSSYPSLYTLSAMPSNGGASGASVTLALAISSATSVVSSSVASSGAIINNALGNVAGFTAASGTAGFISVPWTSGNTHYSESNGSLKVNNLHTYSTYYFTVVATATNNMDNAVFASPTGELWRSTAFSTHSFKTAPVRVLTMTLTDDGGAAAGNTASIAFLLNTTSVSPLTISYTVSNASGTANTVSGSLTYVGVIASKSVSLGVINGLASITYTVYGHSGDTTNDKAASTGTYQAITNGAAGTSINVDPTW